MTHHLRVLMNIGGMVQLGTPVHFNTWLVHRQYQRSLSIVWRGHASHGLISTVRSRGASLRSKLAELLVSWRLRQGKLRMITSLQVQLAEVVEVNLALLTALLLIVLIMLLEVDEHK